MPMFFSFIWTGIGLSALWITLGASYSAYSLSRRLKIIHFDYNFNNLGLSFICLLVLVADIAGADNSLSNDDIFCSGKLLHTIQTSGIYDDSKTFVDKKLKFEPAVILHEFHKLNNMKGNNTIAKLKSFLKSNFDYHGTELVKHLPLDWQPNPGFLKFIKNTNMKTWARAIHRIWKILCRSIKNDVKLNTRLYSLIYLPNPFVIAGGRFREIYYWDSYWVVRGLLRSGMYTTAKGMIDNFVYLVRQFGYVPSCGRIYCQERSQPPLLIQMVAEYERHTKDFAYVFRIIRALEMEFHFWWSKRTKIITIDNHRYRLAIYNSFSTTPRPESYQEDYELTKNLPEEKKQMVYSAIKASVESGWHFSSRWANKDSNSKLDLTSNIKNIVPVDLNAILCSNALAISNFYARFGWKSNAETFYNISVDISNGIRSVLWNKVHGIWMDYNINSRLSTNRFYPSNLAPLWLPCSYNKTEFDKDKIQVVSYFKNIKNSLSFTDAGILTSTIHSGEKWDYPYAWAPLQDIVISALEGTNAEGKKMALELVEKWLKTVHNAFVKNKRMYENYDLSKLGKEPGEYDVELGFGWTNAIAQEYLYKYGHKMFL